MQKLNLKTILLFFPGPVGGAEKVVAEGFRALLAAGQDVELWVVGESRAPKAIEEFRLLIDDLSFKEFQCESTLDTKLIKKIKAELKHSGPAIIHAHGFKATFYAYLCKRREKLVVTHHGKTAHTLKVRLYEMIEDFIMKRADKVIAVSKEMKSKLSDKNIKSIAVENFLTFKPHPLTPLPSSPLKLLFVGRLSPEKGCQFLIKAIELSANDIHLTIVGEGVLRTELEAKTTLSNIKFLGFRNDIAHLMSEHHALVMPSLREGMPLTLIEATCLGLPIIASNVGGIPELVVNNKNGLLIDPQNSSALQIAISHLNAQYNDFKKGATELAPHYIHRFSPKTWAERTIDIYSSLSH